MVEEKSFPRFAGFEEYTKRVRPMLAAAFRNRLSELMKGIDLQDGASFESVLSGGKMIRGCLLCLIADCLGAAVEAAIPRAVAVELIQAASLLHDDFVDQDTIRRSQSATWTLEGARRAVLLGDLLFASAIKMMTDLGSADGSILSDAIARMARGAVHEPLDPQRLLGKEESNPPSAGLRYETIMHLKTGVLFGAACRLGAIAARAGPALQGSAETYGMRIGEAYQVTDDLQDVMDIMNSRVVTAKTIVSLAPALLHFVPEARGHLTAILHKRSRTLSSELVECLETATVRMKDEIERRLQSAYKVIEAVFPQNEAGLLVRRAPRDLLDMFNRPSAA